MSTEIDWTYYLALITYKRTAMVSLRVNLMAGLLYKLMAEITVDLLIEL